MPPKIVGYSRVASGCDYCLVAAGNLYHTDQLMPIHEHCTCGIEPVFEDSNDPRSFHAPEHALPDSELGARIDQTADITAQVEELNAAKPLVWEPGKMSVDEFLAKGGKIEDLPKGLQPKPKAADPFEGLKISKVLKDGSVETDAEGHDLLLKRGYKLKYINGNKYGMELADKANEKLASELSKSAAEAKARLGAEGTYTPPKGLLEGPELEDQLMTHYDGVLSDLTVEQERAWGTYIGPGASKMNAALRGLIESNAELDTLNADLQSALDPLPFSAKTFRGIDDSFAATFGAEPEIGGILEDKAFVSTSADPAVAEEFAIGGFGTIFEVEVPAGTPALYFGTGESELLLPAGSRFVITAIRKENLGDHIADRITIRLVEHGKK